MPSIARQGRALRNFSALGFVRRARLRRLKFLHSRRKFEKSNGNEEDGDAGQERCASLPVPQTDTCVQSPSGGLFRFSLDLSNEVKTPSASPRAAAGNVSAYFARTYNALPCIQNACHSLQQRIRRSECIRSRVAAGCGYRRCGGWIPKMAEKSIRIAHACCKRGFYVEEGKARSLCHAFEKT